MANSFIYNQQKISVGDKVAVHQKIEEGDGKTRTQVFEGLIISIKGRGEGKTFTVRKIGANSIGVERIIPLMSPFLDDIKVVSEGKVRRSKLYYLRDRVGRRALRVKGKTKTYTQEKDAKKAAPAKKEVKKESPKSAPKKKSVSPKKESTKKPTGTKSGASSKKTAAK